MRPLWLALISTTLIGNCAAQSGSTAWSKGEFHVNIPHLISGSDIILERPNLEAGQAMALGNGRLGVAIWSENGLTAQLNRPDALPDRLSAGQVVIPGLTSLTTAKDYAGRLDLYDGEFQEQGSGITVKAYVQPDPDVLVIDVTGADPAKVQTAQLRLWKPRGAQAAAQGSIGTLSEHWIDNKNPGFSGRPFGTLSALTAEGRDVSATATDPLTVTVTFKPFPDGHFRIRAAAPSYNGTQPANAEARRALLASSPIAHQSWWHNFWNRCTPIKISSEDGVGEYLENLRNLYLFYAAAEKGVEYPGSQAGVADMLSSGRDWHQWDSSAFWHWNLRMQVAANLSAGLPELNEPYFNLYRQNLPSIEEWTRKHMLGRPGICIPETMRFNGPGIEYESRWTPATMGLNCDASFKPYYNARTLSTGAEVSYWIWEQYLATNDRAFLERNYPVMAAAARFLLASQKADAEGKLHTSPSNAHETQWDVTDPTTDISGILSLYPSTIMAAKLLGEDHELVQQLTDALQHIPPIPRTQSSGEKTLLPPSADAQGQDIIAESYLPAALNHNTENIGLEPVWPYGLIGDQFPTFDLAKRTYAHRLFVDVADWSYDPLQAARLGLGAEVSKTLVAITEHYQHSPNGLANWTEKDPEFYVEQAGVAAAAIQEALVQDYDGLIRLAPAVPPGWDMAGSVYVRAKTKVDVQVRNGLVTTAVIESGAKQSLRVRNPWPGYGADVFSAGTGEKILSKDSSPILTFPAAAGVKYIIEQHDTSTAGQEFAEITSAPARAPKKLGKVQIGLYSASHPSNN
jgi:alpha-L-fucosidase 2